MRFLWEAVLDLLYPPTCCACGTPTSHPEFCTRCLASIAVPCSPLCSLCGVPFRTHGDRDHLCGDCLTRPPRFARARACAVYDAADAVIHPLKSVLQRYKYNRDVSLAPVLAALLAARAPLAVDAYDVLMPVPLHVDRLRWRGFNQAQLLAQHLVDRSIVDAFSLQRVRATQPQVHLSERERRRNVAGAFQAARPERIAGRRILLIDDVYTTGATVDECSRVLRRAGARSVDVLVLARAVLR